MPKSNSLPMTGALIAGALVCCLILRPTHSHSRAADPSSTDELAQLKAEVARLKGVVPDQSHTMMDVSYHYSNLWFAGQSENWPLAQFYSDETHSHLRWAVRV